MRAVIEGIAWFFAGICWLVFIVVSWVVIHFVLGIFACFERDVEAEEHTLF